jgi:hypothetical protein
MGENATAYALVRSDGKVETFLRLDMPAGWEPEPGYTLVPDDELPEGWERAEPTPDPVPTTVSARQIRLWLIMHGYELAQIEAIISAIPDALQRQVVQVEWEYAPYVDRGHTWVNQLAAVLGMDSAAVDTAFREAAVL